MISNCVKIISRRLSVDYQFKVYEARSFTRTRIKFYVYVRPKKVKKNIHEVNILHKGAEA